MTEDVRELLVALDNLLTAVSEGADGWDMQRAQETLDNYKEELEAILNEDEEDGG